MSVAVAEKSESETRGQSWIGWTDGEDVHPLPPDTVVEVNLRNGATRQGLVGGFRWSRDSASPQDGDIINFRVVRESHAATRWSPWDPNALPCPDLNKLYHVRLREGGEPRVARGMDVDWYTPGVVASYKEVRTAKWYPSQSAQCPVPGEQVYVRMRMHDSFTDLTVADSWTWRGGGEGAGDIMEYFCPDPKQWISHNPTVGAKVPKAARRKKIVVRLRSGEEVTGLAETWKWEMLFRNRDREIVAWRFA